MSVEYKNISDEPQDYCVYVHINMINNKMYIGISRNVANRWTTNGLNYKGCTHFYNAIQKYGWHNFKHIVLLDNLSLSVAQICEQQLIKKYNTINNGYNIKEGGAGGGNIGVNHFKSKPIYQYDFDGNFIKKWDAPIFAQEAYNIKDVSRVANGWIKSAVGYQWSYDYHDKIDPYYDESPIYQYDLDGNFIKAWRCSIDAVKLFGQSIRECASGRYRTSYGYRWSYEKTDTLNPLPPICYSKKNGYTYIDGRCVKEYPRVYQYDLNHNLVHIYESIYEIYDDLNKLEYLKALCKKEIQFVHEGSIWLFENCIDDDYIDELIAKHNQKYKKIDQYDLDGDYIQTFESLSEIEKLFGFHHSIVGDACRGKKKTAYNYQWRFNGEQAPDGIKHEIHKSIKVVQKTLDGQYINTFKSATNAAKTVTGKDNIIGTNILKVCRGQKESAFGYLWQFEDDYLKEV